MENLKLLLMALAIAVACIDIVQAFGQAERNLIVAYHNRKRSEEGGCYMQALRYSKELEARAKEHAERCVYEPLNDPDIGENIARTRDKGSEMELVKKALQMWWEEIYDCNIMHYDCGMSSHYTQMVWSDTREIGCYFKECSSFKFFVCFYSPPICNMLIGLVPQKMLPRERSQTPDEIESTMITLQNQGNYDGEKPFTDECQSPCKPGQSTNNGLCYG